VKSETHLDILTRSGVAGWNQWRKDNPQIVPHFHRESFYTLFSKWPKGRRLVKGLRANLAGINLSCADLSATRLEFVSLTGADLSNANLEGADLTDASLVEARLDGATLRDANLRRADLSKATLPNANLMYAQLNGTNLAGANLEIAIFTVSRPGIYRQMRKRTSLAFVLQIITNPPSPSTTSRSRSSSTSCSTTRRFATSSTPSERKACSCWAASLKAGLRF